MTCTTVGRLVVACALAFAGLVFEARAADLAAWSIVDFQDVTVPPAQNYTIVTGPSNAFTDEGYTFTFDTTNGGVEHAIDGAQDLSGQWLWSDTNNVTMTNALGDNFQLGSFWMGEETGTGGGPRTITVTGTLAVGGTVTQTFGLDGFFVGPPATNNNDFQEFNLPTNWGILSSVTITDPAANFEIDNVWIAPEPGSLMLLAAGAIGLLAVACRRRRA